MPNTPFIITVDTEGDNLWERPREIGTRNAEFLPRFQMLCERFGFKPVYLTNYEMAMSDAYVEFARDVLCRDACEIGMHLHAWNSPPLQALTEDDFFHQPYLIEYPDSVMREKIHVMTALLEDKFDRKMISHRAGRWGFDERYAAMLLQEGYQVDCSVTPGVNWGANRGNPNGNGGSNYEAFPDHPYFLDPANISAPAPYGLLEVPMTIVLSSLYRKASYLYRVPLLRRAANRLSPGLSWLCPVQPSLGAPLARSMDVMLQMARATRNEGVACMEFMLHSSELMPGGSPNFATPSDIDQLYDRLEMLFEELSTWCYGLTLHEFRDLWIQLCGHTGMRAFAYQQPDQTGALTATAQFNARSIPVGKQAIPE
ncbi:MAG TPA: deacetylase [Burkholderiales bacterium]|nr:deacetylase [Burkholderiales bacterium]